VRQKLPEDVRRYFEEFTPKTSLSVDLDSVEDLRFASANPKDAAPGSVPLALGGDTAGATFGCGQGQICSASGWTAIGGITTEWYRVNNIFVGDDFEICGESGGCP
jgi:hypothetical protein